MILSAILVVVSIFVASRTRSQLRLFQIIFNISGLYYGLIGPAYWLYYEDGEFLGLNWSAEIPEAASIISFGTLLVTTFCYLLSRYTRMQFSGETFKMNSPLMIPFLLISLITTLAVIASANNRGSFFLIAYQFSDLAIPTLLYYFASGKTRRLTPILAIFAFFGYTIFVGFRYKTILIIVPFLMIVASQYSGRQRLLMAVVAGPLVVAGLSIMTVVRSKFSGINTEGLNNVSNDRILYSLFAESNTIFGMASVLRVYVHNNTLIYFVPLIDTVLELIPRAVFPERVTGLRIDAVLNGLQTDEGRHSGTTYPYVGEMLMMGGYPGLIVGCLLISLLVVWLHKKNARWSLSPKVYSGGIGLIGVTFGYYFVSRGYMPQFAKAVLFVIAPYMLLIGTSQKKGRIINR